MELLTKRVVNGVTHEYFYDGDKLIAEKVGDKYFYFFYDESGVCGFRYENIDYEYVKNIFGDVIGIYNEYGTHVATYAYDAWGNMIYCNAGTDVAYINPFLYRGYYYDSESGLYYLMTRYYDTQIGRFISPDMPDYLAPDTVGGVDLYAYYRNNPLQISRNYQNYAKSLVSPAGRKISDNNISERTNESGIGFAVNYAKETIISSGYYWLFELEYGIGYAKSFDNNKPVNFYVSIPERWWRFNDYYAGFDFNINGFGGGIALGGENSLTFHLGNHSLDIFSNTFGRIGWKWITEDSNGNYTYFKFEFNVPEIVLTGVALYYCGKYIVTFLELLLGGKVIA